jgi:putative membrane protein
MEVVINFLFWLHLIALALGGAAAFGIPVVGRKMPTAAPEVRPELLSVIRGLSAVGRAGIGTLIVTGPLIVWLKYGGFGGMNIWFWVKMVLVVALLGGVIYAGILLKRSAGGDMASAQLGPRVGMVNTLLFIAVVFSAVFAFEIPPIA